VNTAAWKCKETVIQIIAPNASGQSMLIISQEIGKMNARVGWSQFMLISKKANGGLSIIAKSASKKQKFTQVKQMTLIR